MKIAANSSPPGTSPPTAPLGTLRTECLVARRVTCDRSWAAHGQTEHNDPFGRIYYLASGNARVTHHGHTFALRPGRLYAIPAFTPSWYRCDRRMDLFYLHYRADILGALEPFDYFGWDFVVPAQPASGIEKIWSDLIRPDPTPNASRALQQDAGLRQILARFAATRRPTATVQMQSVKRFQPVFVHIAEHLHRPLALSELAALVHLHPTYFSNLFTRVVGLTPIQYTNRKRIERAQILLLNPATPIKDIAAGLGFADVFYFSRTFRKMTGLPPSTYRARAPTAP